MRGEASLEKAESLKEAGYEAYSLEGGYYQYLAYKMLQDENNPYELKNKFIEPNPVVSLNTSSIVILVFSPDIIFIPLLFIKLQL